ncbi:hypothetical protein V1511DRAFT_522103 [Dipodascopsis uninucleata]
MDASAEITRCICGHDELQTDDPDSDSGLFIQCDKCQVWQHAYCVGIGSSDVLPDDYSCEKCSPELHLVVVRPTGKTSKYIPLLEANAPRQKERPSRHSGSANPNGNSNNSNGNNGPNLANNVASSHKRRSTLNSRDSNYEEILKRVLEESANESGVQTTAGTGSDNESGHSSRSSRSSRGKKRGAKTAFEEEEDDGQEDDIQESNDRENQDDSSETNGQFKRKKVNGGNGIGTLVHTGKSQDEPDASTGAQEFESLKKNDDDEHSLKNEPFTEGSDAINNNDGVDGEEVAEEEDEEGTDDNFGRRSSSRSNSKRLSNKPLSGRRDRKRARTTASPPSNDEDDAASRSSSAKRASSRKRNSSEPVTEPTKLKAENDSAPEEIKSKELENETETAENDSPKKDRSSPARAGSTQPSQSRNHNDETESTPTTQTTIDKPSKPRIPQSKTTIVEMRKRVAAILEFIGRTQDERKQLYARRRRPDSRTGTSTPNTPIESEDTIDKSEISKVDEEEVNGLFGTQKISLEMMDGLTRKLLIWEQQFGRHGDKN